MNKPFQMKEQFKPRRYTACNRKQIFFIATTKPSTIIYSPTIGTISELPASHSNQQSTTSNQPYLLPTLPCNQPCRFPRATNLNGYIIVDQLNPEVKLILFQTGRVSWNESTSINILFTNTKESSEKFWSFFSQFKTAF